MKETLLPAIRFPGIRHRFEGLLNELATASTMKSPTAAAGYIRRASNDLERWIAEGNVQPSQLTDETRAIRGWLAFLTDRSNIDNYIAAHSHATRAFTQALEGSPRFSAPILVHLKPMQGMFRLRGYADCTVVSLPTPTITFDRKTLSVLADVAACRTTDKQPVVEAMTGGPYQDVQAELEALGGLVERAVGTFHDLNEAFDRVNKAYFQRKMTRPRLAWSRTLTNRKFGHYDRIRDTVMVSSSLDQRKVPEFLVDFIVYHELLHRKLGISWRNGRAMSHTVAFKQSERLFR